MLPGSVRHLRSSFQPSHCGSLCVLDRRRGYTIRVPFVCRLIEVELEQPALDRAIVKHDAARRFEPDAFGQGEVASENPRGPSGPTLLEGIADLAIEIFQRALVAEAFPVGRIADQCSPLGRRLEPGKIML